MSGQIGPDLVAVVRNAAVTIAQAEKLSHLHILHLLPKAMVLDSASIDS